MEVRRRSVRDVRQHSELSAVRTFPANPEGGVSCGRAELVNVVEQITVDRVGAGVGGTEDGTFECRVQVPVMSWSENPEGLRIENRHRVGVGLGDDVPDAVDLVRRMGGRHIESRHVGRQSYGHVVFLITVGHHADRTFEEGGELLEVGLARVAIVEREGRLDTILHDRQFGLGTSLLAHVPYLNHKFDIRPNGKAHTVEPMGGFPFIPAFRGDAECTRSGTIEYAGEPRWNLAVNIKLYRVWLFGCVVETVRDRGLELLWSGRHGRGSERRG